MEHVDFAYGATKILRDITITVRPGARIGVIGESGSGKSTLARLLVGLLSPSSGRLTINGRPWPSVPRTHRLRRAVQLIHQDPYAQLTPHVSARSAVTEAARVCQGLSRKDAATLADHLLTSVGLAAAPATRRPSQLSGGQNQRVAIARALAANPAIIVADEPTSALDMSMQAQIINVLLQLMDSRTLSMVLVSHDLAVTRHLTTEVFVIHQGTIVERGATEYVLTSPQHPYTRQLVQNAPWGCFNITPAPISEVGQ